jgi:predicted methyltransferase
MVDTSRIPVSEIFVPGEYPKYTLVERRIGGATFSERVADVLETRGMMAALVGPSKSGKTQLLVKALQNSQYKRISCSEIRSRDDLINEMRIALSIPLEESLTHETKRSDETSNSAGLSGGSSLLKGS